MMLTNLLLSAVNLILAAALFVQWSTNRQSFAFFWALAFLAAGFASGLAGFYHGYLEQRQEAVLSAFIWKSTVYCVGIASLCLLIGGTWQSLPYPYNQFFLFIAGLKAAIFLGWMMRHDSYAYVILDYGASMAIVALVQIYLMMNRSWLHGSDWVLGGIIISFFAAFVQQYPWKGIGVLTANDLYHILQSLGVILMYQGIVQRLQSLS